MITPPVATDTGNWAGYVWHAGSHASARFRVPAMPNPSAAERENHTVLSIWVALGHLGSPYLAQAGVYDYWQNGRINWAGVCAWWPLTNDSCGEGIKTGDEMSVSVSRSGLNYTMTLRDEGPYNKWVVTIKRDGFPALDQGTGIAEDSTYPGHPMTPLSKFTDIPFVTNGTPSEEIYSSNVGTARKAGKHSFWIKR